MQGATTVTRPIPAAVQAVVACVARAVDGGAHVPFGRFAAVPRMLRPIVLCGDASRAARAPGTRSACSSQALQAADT